VHLGIARVLRDITLLLSTKDGRTDHGSGTHHPGRCLLRSAIEMLARFLKEGIDRLWSSSTVPGGRNA
jgi:hypothetical protein